MLIFWLIMVSMTLMAMGILIYALRGAHKRYGMTIGFLFTVAAFFLYFQWGNSQQLGRYFQQQKNIPLIEAELARYQSPQALIDRMQIILQTKSNDPRGWFLLGRLYASTAQYLLAEQAFLRANQLKPHQMEFMQAYIEASFYAHHQLTRDAHQYIHQILYIQKDNPSLLNFLALDAYTRHDYQKAVYYWEKLLPQLDPSSEEAKKIVRAIAKAQIKKIPPSLMTGSVKNPY